LKKIAISLIDNYNQINSKEVILLSLKDSHLVVAQYPSSI
jgi:hypothetical protein